MDGHRPVAKCLWIVTALVLALAGCSDDETSPDTTAPAAVDDLAAAASSHEEVVLTFTYTGDSGTSGTASQCDIRYSTAALTEANFDAATALATPPAPTASGTVANVTVSGLTPETDYYFALKLADEVPNWSEMSNVATATTQEPPDVTPPTQVADLTVSVQPGANAVTLSWTAPTDPAKSVVAYSLRYTTDATDLDESTWAEATEVAGLPAPDPGSTQEVTVSDLAWETTYHFGLKSRDEAPNWSPLSNVIHVIIPEQTPDVTAPAQVLDLAAVVDSESAITLTWTAPGDNGDRGTATEYDLRWALEPLTEMNWNAADQLSVPAPGAAGTAETFQATGLDPETTYHFGLKTADEVPNWSDMSNAASATTLMAQMTQFTSHPNDENYPAWSPDGDRFAYRRISGGVGNIWIMDIEAGTADQLTSSGTVWNNYPAWSVDDMIAFYSKRDADGDQELFQIPADGIDPDDVEQLTTNTWWDSSPAWSPDGTQLAFSSPGTGGQKSIWVLTVSGGALQEITDGTEQDDYPAWSPDGTQIAFQRVRDTWQDIAVVPAGGGAVTLLTDDEVFDGFPCWSPDGQWIAFNSKRSDGVNQDIYIMTSSGASLTRMTTHEAYDGEPCWSPDGASILFTSEREGNLDIWRLRADLPGS